MVRLNPFVAPRAIVRLTVGLLALGLVPAPAGAQVVQDPDSARLVLDDLQHFTDALLALPSARTATESVAVLKRHYFDRATPGLRAYIERYAVRPDSLAAIIARRARYYQSLADMSQRVAALEPELRAAFTALKRLYPPAVYPPVYFLVANCGRGRYYPPRRSPDRGGNLRLRRWRADRRRSGRRPSRTADEPSIFGRA